MQAQTITTVLDTADTYDLTNLAVIKGLLNIPGTAQDQYLGMLISAASTAAAQYCNRVFPSENVLDEFWLSRGDAWKLPGGFSQLQLSRWPVCDVNSVVISHDPASETTTLTEDTDFRVDNKNGQLIRLNSNGNPCKWLPTYVAVNYVGGFDDIPADVTDAVCRMVRSRYYANSRDPMLRSENIVGVYEAQYWIAVGSTTGNMMPDVADVLDNYRVPVVA